MTRELDRIRLENLQRLIAEAGSAAALARRAGVSSPYLSGVRAGTPYPSGRARRIGDRLAAKLERATDRPRGWMDEPRPDHFPSPGQGLPVVSWVQAGCWTEARAVPDDAERLHCPLPCGPDTFVLIVAGESMAPRFPNGEYVFVDPDVPADNGSFVVVRRNGDSAATFKQLVEEDGRRYLQAANPDWPERIVEVGDDAEFCGVVVFQGRPA